MRLLAPAKLNLHLRVGPRDEASGYHPLSSWLCTIGLFDTLTIRPSDGPDAPIILSCDDPTLPCDSSNLVLRAALALAQRATPQRRCGIFLAKRIPIGAGLGGGSSDAARTLLGLNRFWNLGLPLTELHPIAAQLGSDVPFFLHGPSSICTGRGEIVRPTAAPKRARWAVLILPGFALSTAQVYARFDQLRLGDVGSQAQPPWQEWADLSAEPLLSRLRNDLEPAAFAIRPELGNLRDALEASLGRVIRMTGSGSALFTLFDDRRGAETAAAQIVREHPSLRAIAAGLAPRIDDDDLSR
jgi:4-diphosphocytidyl-2-C-methyl-D-erythritol kinase